MVMKMLSLNCIQQTWVETCFAEWISHVCGICVLQVSYFPVDEVTLFLTHISTVTVTLYEITVMCRHYQWYEVSQTQVFLQSLYRPGQALRVPGCQPYTLAAFTPQGDIPCTHCCYRLSWFHAHSVAERIMPTKNSSDAIGNQTRDIPASSSVPQPTMSPSALTNTHYSIYISQHSLWYEDLWHTQVLHKTWTALQ